jgi:hypothetical protein
VFRRGRLDRQFLQGDQLFGDQSGDALGQQAIQQSGILAPKPGQQIVIDRSPVLLTQAVNRSRRADPLQRRIKPNRQHNLRIGCRPATAPRALIRS